MTWAVSVPLAIGLLFWIVYRSWIYPFYVSPLRHIPTVPGSALIGHAHIRLANEFGVPEREWHSKYGLVIRYFLPFGAERLSIADLEAIKEITVRNVDNFVKPRRVVTWMKGILGERGILLVDGEEHAKQRKALAPAFSTSSIRALEHIFWEKGLLLSSLLGKELKQSQGDDVAVEVLGWLNRATLDVISSAAFAYNVDSLRNPEAPLRKAYSAVFAFDPISCIVQGLRLYIDKIKYLPSEMNRSMENGSRVVSDTATDIVRRKLDAKEGNLSKDIISLVVKHNESLPKESIDRLSFEDIRDQVMTFLGAGHDTTATGVAWTIDLLSKHQEIQDKLRIEIIEAIHSLADASPDDLEPESLANLHILDKLSYLETVCKESLRFIPPIPTTIRKALSDSFLAGHFIPADTNIYVMSNTINHLPHFWGPNASRFDPDRWDDLPEQWHSSAFQTFLEGPRGCIGRRFAEVEMKVFLCCLLAKFKFERDESWPDQEERKMWRLVLRPRDGICVKMSLVKS